MPMGNCPECGYSPVAPGAKACVRCGARNPNPTVTDRLAGRCSLAGFAIVGLAGGLYGFFGTETGGAVGAVLGVLLAGLPGLFLGLIVGLVLGFVTWLSGKR